MTHVLLSELIKPHSLFGIVCDDEFEAIRKVMFGQMTCTDFPEVDFLSPVYGSREAMAAVLGAQPGDVIVMEASELGNSGVFDLTLRKGESN